MNSVGYVGLGAININIFVAYDRSLIKINTENKGIYPALKSVY